MQYCTACCQIDRNRNVRVNDLPSRLPFSPDVRLSKNEIDGLSALVGGGHVLRAFRYPEAVVRDHVQIYEFEFGISERFVDLAKIFVDRLAALELTRRRKIVNDQLIAILEAREKSSAVAADVHLCSSSLISAFTSAGSARTTRPHTIRAQATIPRIEPDSYLTSPSRLCSAHPAGRTKSTTRA
jgi:hypothetical protein